MKIIIPMSGFGNRFRQAGYLTPKPLIEVDGKPIISHIIDMFNGEKDFIFICNNEHLNQTNMIEILNKYCPSGKIIGIEKHKKGPVYAVSKVFNLINNDEPVFVNYCDFCCYWDFEHFKKLVSQNKLDGIIPAYKDFHPHSLRNNNYAFLKVKDFYLEEIKEKEPFTKTKINEFASSGTYFFKKGSYIKTYFSKLIEKDIRVNNEFYCSLIYNLMKKDGLKIGVYELEHFMQWGTPEDLREYQEWSNIFLKLTNFNKDREELNLTTMITMAGKGSRFKKEGYKKLKPMIEVSQEPMIIKALDSLPFSRKYRFVCQRELLNNSNIETKIKDKYPNSLFFCMDNFSKGQAISALNGIKELDADEPLTVSACDHGMLFNSLKFKELFNNQKVDIIVWASKWHNPAAANPNMYSWLKVDNLDNVIDISLKKAFDDNQDNPVVIGTFTFKKTKDLINAINNEIKREGLINNEYYIDGCIIDSLKMGLNIKVFYIDHFLCWGTPNELRTFEYWQSCFHKWQSHPYSWEKDLWRDKKVTISRRLKKPFIPCFPL